MANLITLARFPLLIIIVLLLYAAGATPRLVGVPLLLLLIGMDSLDGIVARARGETSLLGSVLDIMMDRTVELVLWVVYAHLGLISVVIPLVYVVRGTVVDALRGLHVREGETPFGAMRTKIGKWLVASSFMRGIYGASKLVSFAGLATAHALQAYALRGAVSTGLVATSSVVFNVTSWIALGFCLARGLPVVMEAVPTLADREEQKEQG
ncbi:MAG: CDP-alcohol phosphatidyltransferase family protein [Chloroflexota bacterium]